MKMARQYIKELHVNGNVSVFVNGVPTKEYHKNPKKYESYSNSLVSELPEWQEVTKGNEVMYWVWVPELVEGVKAKLATKKNKTYWEKKDRKYQLIAKKDARVEKYRKEFESNPKYEILGDEQDFRESWELLKLEQRKMDSFHLFQKLINR